MIKKKSKIFVPIKKASRRKNGRAISNTHGRRKKISLSISNQWTD
jgi:hypothetical protein